VERKMETKDNLKLKFVTTFLIIAIIIIIIMGVGIYKLYEDKQSLDKKLSTLNNEVVELQNIVNNCGIIKYELQTHEYFSNLPSTNKYFINSETELEKFYDIYSNKLDINMEYLKSNSMFIQVEQVGSGSIQMKLADVTFDNGTVNFIVNKSSPEIGTADMAFWYLVAIIPNNKLNDLDLSNWSKPSEIRSEDYS